MHNEARSSHLRRGGVAAMLLALAMVAGACSSDEPEAAPGVQAESLDVGTIKSGDDNGSSTLEVEDNSVDSADADQPEADDDAIDQTGQDLTGEELEAFVARRYEAYWEAFDIARRAPSEDPATDYPTLFNLAAGEQLEQAYAQLEELSSSGTAIRDPEVPAIEGLDQNTAHRIRIESIEEGVAELVTCLVNDQVTYNVADGSILSDSVRTVQARATMAKADGVWKLIRSQATSLEDGVGGCWLDDESEYKY